MSTVSHLSTVTAAIEQVLAGTVEPEHARATLASCVDVLRQLCVNVAPDAEADPPQPGTSGCTTDASARVRAGLRWTGSLDLPHAYLGGIETHERAEEALRHSLTVEGVDSARVQKLLTWEHAGLCRMETRKREMGHTSGKSHESAPSIDRDRLEAYLRSVSPAYASLRITELRQLAGGRSKQTALVQLSNAQGLPGSLVVRRDHPAGATGTSVIREFPLLRHLHQLGLRVPQPILAEPSTPFIDGAFIIVAAVPGNVAAPFLEPIDSPHVAIALAAQLGRLHSISDVSGFFPESATTASIRDSVTIALDDCEKTWNRSEPPPSLAMRFAFQWLRAHVDASAGSPVLVHRDAGFHNVLRHGDELTSLLDWEFAGLGHPAEDLSYVRPCVEAALPWSEFMSAYEQAGGPRVTNDQLQFYDVWVYVRLAALVAQVRHMINQGATQDVGLAVASMVNLHRILRRASAALRNCL